MSGARSSFAPEQLKRVAVAELLCIDLAGVLGFEVYHPHERDSLLRQAREVIDKRLERRLSYLLSSDDHARLDLMLERSEYDQVPGFLRSRIPSLDLVTAEVVTEFRQDLETWKSWVASDRARAELESSDR